MPTFELSFRTDDRLRVTLAVEALSLAHVQAGLPPHVRVDVKETGDPTAPRDPERPWHRATARVAWRDLAAAKTTGFRADAELVVKLNRHSEGYVQVCAAREDGKVWAWHLSPEQAEAVVEWGEPVVDQAQADRTWESLWTVSARS